MAPYADKKKRGSLMTASFFYLPLATPQDRAVKDA
jgi:hypothetical protein